MAQRITPQLIAGGVIILAALVICLSPLLNGTGDYPVLVTDPRVVNQGGSLLSASAATEAVVPSFVRLPDGNPFTLRKGTPRGPRIPLPPPPPLTPPSPPVLPMPEVQ